MFYHYNNFSGYFITLFTYVNTKYLNTLQCNLAIQDAASATH